MPRSVPRSIALWLLRGSAALALVFGVRYAFATRLMPYHDAFLGDAGERAAMLVLLQYKVFGGTFAAAGIVTAILAPAAARGEPRAWWAVLVLGALLGGPVAWVTWQVGHGAPVWAPVANLAVLALALALTRGRAAAGG